ncbi:MAG: hypothetical protein H6Q41_2181 [Deltaproteobacteria bacterium]|jgi:hypothetical protein|nr:hypothetical protein [Deltaproteobacteria bacterium]
MRCRFNNIIWFTAALLIAQAISGCVSLQIEKIQEGVDVLPPPDEFIQKKTSLEEILSCYGAPTDLVDMNGDFALHYRRALYRGMNVSIGIPLKYALLPSPSIKSTGNLLRYDTVVFIFTADRMLKDMKYEKGTDRSLWEDYW